MVLEVYHVGEKNARARALWHAFAMAAQGDESANPIDGERMDIELHYTEVGNGEPLILLHGNGEDSTYFEHQIACFKSAYRVIAIDSRGHGKSPRGTAPLTLGQFARDLADFMDGLELETAHMLGFSDGANVALLFALDHPARVRSLVLNGGNLFPDGLTEQTRREIDEEYQEALAAGDEGQVELLRLMIDEPRIDPSSLAALRMPVLVIAGTDDMIEERHTRLIAESIPDARLAFVEGTHYVASENPDAFNRAIAAFLSECRHEGETR